MKAAILILLSALSCHCQTLQESRWRSATLEPRREHEAGLIVARIMAAKQRYQAVDAATNVPWYATAGIHSLESDGSFTHHLYEGSPLTGRTRFVPKGQPPTGTPPFTWEESAIGALRFDHLDLVDWRTLNATLYACERYNGTGYLRFHPTVPTPYLWAGTNLEVPGKFVADGKWSSTARSSQLGIAAIWKEMEALNIVRFSKLK